MYVVVDKSTGKILHTNPAPTHQGLEGTEVYFRFDPETMKIGQTDEPLPESFEVVGDRVIELSLEEQVERGIVSLEPHEIVREGKIVEMRLEDKVEAGLVRLDPSKKIVREQGIAQIVGKTLRDLIDDGTLELPPTKKISDDGEGIVDKTIHELLDERIIDLLELKERRAIELTGQALEARRRIVPDHELSYAALGVRSEDEVQKYREVIRESERSLARAKKRLEKAGSADEVLAIEIELPEP